MTTSTGKCAGRHRGRPRLSRALRGLALSGWLAALPASLLAFEDVALTVNNGPADAAALADMTEMLRGASLLVSQIGAEGLTSRDIVASARSDYTRLVEALFSAGHYSTIVRITLNGQEARAISPLAVPEAITDIAITVDPGPQFVFGRAEVGPVTEGTTLPPGFATGQPARAELVRSSANSAVRGWQDRGHPKAAVAGQSVNARHRVATLDVAVDVDPGPRLRFRDPRVSGETIVNEARVRQIAGLPAGAYYSPEEVTDAGARLRRTGTFRSVRLVEGEALPDGTLDMEIVVADRLPRRIGAGAELSSDDGLTLTGFWLHRNILGGAESLRFDAEIRQIAGVDSGVDYFLRSRFERPAVLGADTLAFAEAEISREDEADFLINRASIGAGLSRKVTDDLTIEGGVALAYSEVTDRFLPGDPTRELFYVSLPVSAEYDRRNDELDATGGYYILFEGAPFVETLNQDTGARLDLDTRVYQSLGSDRFVLAGRAVFGSLFGVEPEDAPPNFLYYSGGGGVVRGQPYQSLSIDYGDVTLGGRSFIGLSGEMRVGVTDTIGAVLFADAGFLSGDSDFSALESHAGAGVGVRYKTPVGPLRVDVAGPISGDTGDGIQFYIGIGQAF